MEKGIRLRDKAYRQFTKFLLSRKLRPGEFVTQRELVELTGLSLGSIRELIPRLEAEGLMTTLPQRGLQVTQLDMRMVREAYQLRRFLELQAVKSFAVNGSADAIEALDADLKEAVARAQQGPLTRKLLDELLEVDWHFHDVIIDALDNHVISNVYRINSIRIRLIRMERVILSEENLSLALSEHADIIAELRERDADGAVSAMERHIDSALNRSTVTLMTAKAG